MKTAGIRTHSFLYQRLRITALMLAGVFAAAASGCSGPATRNVGSAAGSAASARVAANGTESKAAAAASTNPAEKGKQLFGQTCTSCHGMNGQGVPHLGADLRTSHHVAKSTDAQLESLIEHGVPASSPLNTSHVPMPPKGANPSLNHQDIHDIVLYIRQLEEGHGERK